ncbi:MAG: hypothetical protein H7A21_01345 [Spirochaetales bacterium]|nr:hypothetical protein [Leptospiraceae bacterium]MCP5480054.1 hypothetical protein [Spirochaetales bacterium]MCP5485605.1 hypothetical protein [Spirochaetales bacterium]
MNKEQLKERIGATWAIVRGFWYRTLVEARRLPEHARTAKTAFVRYIHRLGSEPRVRFKTLAWSIVAVFLGISILSSSNPYRLLVPFLAFPLPVPDEREPIELYGISRESRQSISVRRLLDTNGDIEERAHRIARVISMPPGLRESVQGTDYYSLDYLPEFNHAIRKIWFVPDMHSGLLIIDIRRATLDDEVQIFFSAHEAHARTETEIVDAYFHSLTASIFSAIPEVQCVQYLIDGQPGSIPGVRFPLDVRYTRPDGQS